MRPILVAEIVSVPGPLRRQYVISALLSMLP
jgi:hypothetical protein